MIRKFFQIFRRKQQPKIEWISPKALAALRRNLGMEKQ